MDEKEFKEKYNAIRFLIKRKKELYMKFIKCKPDSIRYNKLNDEHEVLNKAHKILLGTTKEKHEFAVWISHLDLDFDAVQYFMRRF